MRRGRGGLKGCFRRVLFLLGVYIVRGGTREFVCLHSVCGGCDKMDVKYSSCDWLLRSRTH